MALEDKSNTYAGVGIGASGVGSLVSILAFALPYWIYYKEDLTLSDATGSYQVQFTYYYGFWKYCNKVLSDVSNSDTCGSVETHSDVEQTASSLLLLSILLFVSALVNGCLYLTAFKKERLCLYIAWVSVVVAGVFALTSIVTYARTDHSVTVTDGITLNFSASKLHASFWLVVTGCFMVAIATIFITLAIINARRSKDKSDSRKSILSYDPVDKKVKEVNDIPEEYEYKDPIIPEAYSYRDSPYSTSSESLSGIDVSDSDDSDIDPKFAKLKTKVTPKPPGLKSVEADTLEIRRCRSGEPPTVVSPTPKRASASLHRSRSASALTPIEQADLPDFAADKLRTGSGKKQVINLDPAQNIDSNMLYFDNVNHLELGTAPVATNLTFSVPRPVVDSSDGLVLRRAKTDMPFTQRMRDTIGQGTKSAPHPTVDQKQSVREPAEIMTESAAPPLPFKRKALPKKGHKSKSKQKKPSEENLRRKRELTEVYSAASPIKTFFPGQHSQKPAPWSKARDKLGLPPKTSQTMKWSLAAYGADFAEMSKQLKSAKKKHKAREEAKNVGPMEENSSEA